MENDWTDEYFLPGYDDIVENVGKVGADLNTRLEYMKVSAHPRIYQHIRQIAPTTNANFLWFLAEHISEQLSNEDLAALAGAIRKSE